MRRANEQTCASHNRSRRDTLDGMSDTLIQDPLGREIVLSDRTWFGHILKGHPEMAQHRSLAERAISNPDEIRVSLSDSRCRLYFGPGPWAAVRIIVVADVVAGRVKTAHLAKKISGGPREWPS